MAETVLQYYIILTLLTCIVFFKVKHKISQ